MNNIPIKAKLSDYTWSELSILSKSHVDFDKYNIRVGDSKDGKILVDISDKDYYNGLVFMYNTKTTAMMNPSTRENKYGYNRGGYAASEMSRFIENLYDKLEDTELKTAIKEVTIKCNDGYDNFEAIHELKCHIFLPSVREVGFNTTYAWYKKYESFLDKEGAAFAYFVGADAKSRRANFSAGSWWLHSADGNYFDNFWCVNGGGDLKRGSSYGCGSVVAAFVL